MIYLLPRQSEPTRQNAAALLIVLAFLVLLAGVTVAYLARTSTDRQVAQSSFSDAKADQLARSALDVIVGDFKQEIVNGSTASTVSNITIYTPSTAANIVPQAYGTPTSGTPIPNLIRRSLRSDNPASPAVGSRGSALNAAPSPSGTPTAKGEITTARWNKHYLIPKANTANDQTDPVGSFTAPDWVFVTSGGPTPIPSPTAGVVGRYAYAIYDEGGLLDINVAGYPIPTPAPVSSPAQPYAFKSSLAYADLSILPTSTASPAASFPPSQVNNIVGWRNYASTQPGGDFANNFSFTTAAAQRFFTLISTNTGFLSVPTTIWSGRTDQTFTSRQQLLRFQNSMGFSANVLQYFGTFSRELNAPSSSTFLNVRVAAAFPRFDGTVASVGEPLVKTRFPLSRLAWITYRGPSANLPTTDPVYTALINAGISASTIAAGSAANIQKCFGLVWDSRSYVAATTTAPSQGQQWVYNSPTSSGTGGNFTTTGSGNPASAIKTLATVATENPPREADFFELLQGAILTGSLGQNSGGGVTGSAATGGNVFPDIHMANISLHILSIGSAVIDQADPDSFPMRIQFQPGSPPASSASMWWTACGVENLPYITVMYPVAGTTEAGAKTDWAEYLIFQVWNPAQNATNPPQVRLRLDGGVGVYTLKNNETWDSNSVGSDPNLVFQATGGASIKLATNTSFATPTPLYTINTTDAALFPGPSGAFSELPTYFTAPQSGNLIVGYRLPDHPPANKKHNLILQIGAATPSAVNRFNATMEVDVGGGVFVPYSYFVGINDPGSWITSAPLLTQKSTGPNSNQFDSATLAKTPPNFFLKADPRSTRFGVYQMDSDLANSTTDDMIEEPCWSPTLTKAPNGYGGDIDTNGNKDVEHAPQRFVGAKYFPATLCLNNAASTSTRTGYVDNDLIVRPGDSAYPDPGQAAVLSTPYNTATTSGSQDYRPIMLNRPFRSVGELGYAFRDLPWKTLDFFTDKSGDASLLDVFSVSDETSVVAGHVNLNTRQAPVLQSLLAGAVWNEVGTTSAAFVSKTGSSDGSAEKMAANFVSATSVAPLGNRSELITRATPSPNLLQAILPLPTGATHNQSVKTRREVIPRAIASVTQTRTWNLMIDVIAQSGRYPPTATALKDFVVEGEKRYWLHVAIDRFTGEVIDQQLEAVYE